MNFEVGDIVDYSYLWAHQAAKGEESGRKVRPTCLVFKTKDDPSKLFLFPITSKKPNDGKPFMEIPPLECKRADLNYPSYIILNEFNEDQSDMMFDLGQVEPRGSISPIYLVEVFKGIMEEGRKARPTSVQRAAS